jgi:hypothetical protein
MAQYRPFARKYFGFDRYIKVPTPIACSGVPGVQVALILDEEVCRLEGLIQECLDLGDTIITHGSTLLNGFTVTLW